MQTPPPIPPTRWTIAFWSPEQIGWVLQTLALIASNQEVLMSTIADLKTAADQMAANEQALAAEVGNLNGAVTNLVTAYEAIKNNSQTNLTPADQATLDTAINEVTSASADLASQTQNLTTEQGTIPPTA